MPKPKAKLQAAVMGGSADETETAFYEALQHGDVDAMMACWADEDDIVCVHPGGPRITGPLAIRAVFELMFANGGVPARPQRVRKVESLASSMHNVLERIEVPSPQGPQEAFVVATNVFHKTAQGWRMVAHHASPATADDLHEAGDGPRMVH